MRTSSVVAALFLLVVAVLHLLVTSASAEDMLDVCMCYVQNWKSSNSENDI
jgi:hypothetical protein